MTDMYPKALSLPIRIDEADKELYRNDVHVYNAVHWMMSLAREMGVKKFYVAVRIAKGLLQIEEARS